MVNSKLERTHWHLLTNNKLLSLLKPNRKPDRKCVIKGLRAIERNQVIDKKGQPKLIRTCVTGRVVDECQLQLCCRHQPLYSLSTTTEGPFIFDQGRIVLKEIIFYHVYIHWYAHILIHTSLRICTHIYTHFENYRKKHIICQYLDGFHKMFRRLARGMASEKRDPRKLKETTNFHFLRRQIRWCPLLT